MSHCLCLFTIVDSFLEYPENINSEFNGRTNIDIILQTEKQTKCAMRSKYLNIKYKNYGVKKKNADNIMIIFV